jgi:hypothetical protein
MSKLKRRTIFNILNLIKMIPGWPFHVADCGAAFRGDEIDQVCASGGMIPVSLDDPHLADELVKPPVGGGILKMYSTHENLRTRRRMY